MAVQPSFTDTRFIIKKEKVEGTIPTIEEIEARLGENLNGEQSEL